MTRPGVEVTSRATLPGAGPSVDTSQWHVVGQVEAGVGEVHRVRSLDEFTVAFGGRVAGGLRDSIEAHFKEGGGQVHVSGVAVAALEAAKIAALDLLPRALGPGQVSMPGETTNAVHLALLAHAAANNRRAVLDLVDDAVAANLIAATALLAGTADAWAGAAFTPPADIPGLVPNTTREIPYSALQSALIAQSDRKFNANVPAAGANGQAQYVLGVKHSWTDVDRENLNEAGVNVGRDVYGVTRTYGYRSLVDPDGPDAPWLAFSSSRLRMQITAEAERIAENFMFAQIDGRLQKVSEFAGSLTGMLKRFYDQGALFGLSPDDAFTVDVGPTVNTPESLALNELRAVLGVRMSPFAELVAIEIVKTPITETLT